MKRFVTALAALACLTAGSAPDPAVAAEAQCCWLYCETYRNICQLTELDRDSCDAWYEGCIDGCQYPKK